MGIFNRITENDSSRAIVGHTRTEAATLDAAIANGIAHLQHRDSYRLILLVHYDGMRCHVSHAIGDVYGLCQNRTNDLPSMIHSLLFRSTVEAISTRRPAINDIRHRTPGDGRHLTASLSIPIAAAPPSRRLSILTFWTTGPEGFTPEEAHLLLRLTEDCLPLQPGMQPY